MTTLNIKGALKKRNELVKLGFTIVPSVMPKPFLNQLQIWSEDIFRRVTIDHKIAIKVATSSYTLSVSGGP